MQVPNKKRSKLIKTYAAQFTKNIIVVNRIINWPNQTQNKQSWAYSDKKQYQSNFVKHRKITMRNIAYMQKKIEKQ